jgi:hypothetical protein
MLSICLLKYSSTPSRKIATAEDFDEALLHRTPEIDNFLSLDRDDKFIVIGTKGFGKTLLLKAKRILYQRRGGAACLPTGNLLDKLIGDKIFGKEALAFFASSSLPWAKVWLAAIAVAVLKHLRQTEGLKVNPRLTRLITDEQLHGVIDHFVRLLDFSPGDLQRSASDTDGHLAPRLRAINTSTRMSSASTVHARMRVSSSLLGANDKNLLWGVGH